MHIYTAEAIVRAVTRDIADRPGNVRSVPLAETKSLPRSLGEVEIVRAAADAELKSMVRIVPTASIFVFVHRSSCHACFDLL